MKRIALAGYGHVGEAFAEILENNPDYASRFEIVAILVKDLLKPRKGLDPSMFFDDVDAFFACEFDVLVDVLSGIEPSLSLITKSLSEGISVITANKASLAKDAPHLFELSTLSNANLYWEASCMSGIPVVHGIDDLRKSDTILSIQGIVNGSTNYCLSRYFNDGIAWDEAIQEATERGFLERDPIQDMGGFDAMRKLQLLSMLAFSVFPAESAILRKPLTSIPESFLQTLRQLGWSLKYVASASYYENQYEGQVVPMVFREKQGLALVSNETNQLDVLCDGRGSVLYTGAGAGGIPTALGIISDLMWLDFGLAMKPEIKTIASQFSSVTKHHYWIEATSSIPEAWILDRVSGLIRTVLLTPEEALRLPLAIQEAL